MIGGKKFKKFFENKKSNGLSVPGHAEGTFDPTVGDLEARHGGEVEVAVELYM